MRKSCQLPSRTLLQKVPSDQATGGTMPCAAVIRSKAWFVSVGKAGAILCVTCNSLCVGAFHSDPPCEVRNRKVGSFLFCFMEKIVHLAT